METISRRVAIRAVVALGLACVGQAASADQIEPARVALSIRDTAQVPYDTLARAQMEMTRIYRQAGIEIVWLPAPSLSGDKEASHESRFMIAILSHAQAQRLDPALTRDAVGVAVSDGVSRGRVAYVFFKRVEQLTGGNGVDLAHVLGIAMAHELGHLLLPAKAHAQAGLMRANWTKKDLQLAQRSRLFFSAEQGELIRSRTGGSVTESHNVNARP